MEEDRALLERLIAAAGYASKAAELAKRLTQSRDALPALLESALHRQARGPSAELRALLALMPSLARQRALDRLGPQPRLNNLERARAFASALYMGENYERVSLIMLDEDFRLIDHCTLLEGGLKEVPLYPRRLLQETLRRKAPVSIICHNHPSGQPCFSDSDISATRSLLRLYASVGLGLADHLLVAGDQVASLRASLLIPEKLWCYPCPAPRNLSQWRGPAYINM